MKYFKPLFVFVIGSLILLFSQSFNQLFTFNGITQLTLFALVVCWPIWKTGRLSYVDIGWPWGLVSIGIITLLFSEGYVWRVRVVGGIYLFIGLRMGIGALKLWWKGYMKKEFPRYQYQRRRWERAGKTNIPLAMQVDALAQGLANASFLAFPAFIIGSNPNVNFSVFEIIGLILWILAFIFETVADAQKSKFIRKMYALEEKNKVCDIGLWKYTRHPNYFAEWMVWNALVIAAIPSWIELQSKEVLLIWIALGLGLLFVSRIMYLSLVYLTGAVPSEYYSLKKRPDYAAYQKRVNRFFPGRPK
ncbi:MAG: DUF1295 domain-containing protein [Bacteroidota bacterium]